MLSHLKSRDLAPAPAPAPMETGSTNVSRQEPTNVSSKIVEAEQQAAARLTCDALCSLANSSGQMPSNPTTAVAAVAAATPSTATAAAATILPNSIPGQPLGMHGFLYMDRSRSAVAPAPVAAIPKPPPTTSNSSSSTCSTAKTSTKIKACPPKQHQLPLFLSSKFFCRSEYHDSIFYR